jgi:hypothetical protein
MAKRDLSSETMIHLTEALLDPTPKGARTILAGLPIVSVLIPKIEEAHAILLSRQVASPPGEVTAKITAIQVKQTALDARHDRKMRGSIKLLEALADLADEPDDARRYLELRDVLCPDGLKGIIKSYVDEAGAATLLQGRLDDPKKKQLGKIAIPGGKLLDVVNDWMASAEELGALESDKTALTKLAEAPEGRRPQDAIDARNRWIRVVAALETALAISGADEATVAAILAPLQEAEAKAARRKATAGRAPATESPKPAAPVAATEDDEDNGVNRG